MPIPLQVTLEGGLESSETLERRIRREAGNLERFHAGITGCRVAVIGRGGQRQALRTWGPATISPATTALA